MKHSVYKILILLSCMGILYISFGNSYAANSSQTISTKTQILMSRYPEIQEKVDVILSRVYKKLETRSLELQKSIYIKLQERIQEFEEKYVEKPIVLILLKYIYESVGVQIYNIDIAMQEASVELDAAPEKIVFEIQTTPVPAPVAPKKIQTPKKVPERTTSTRVSTPTPTPPETPVSPSPEEEAVQQTITQEEVEAPETGTQTGSTVQETIEEENGLEENIGEETSPQTEETSNEEVISQGPEDEEIPTPEERDDSENIDETPVESTIIGTILETESVEVVIEEEQTLQVNEIGRFTSTVNIQISSLVLTIIGDRDFSFADNTLYIREINGVTLAESISHEVIAGNFYQFTFENIDLPEGTILLQTNQFSIDPDANTEVSVKAISIPENPEMEGNFLGTILLAKDRIQLQESENSQE